MAERRYFSEIMNMNAGGIEMSTEAEDEEKAVLFKEPMRRNLVHLFDNAVPSEVADEHMAVYLRVRPFSAQELEANENQGCLEVQNEYLISANAPKDSHTYKTTTYGLGKARHNFTFSRVFPETTTQKDFFNGTMLKLVQDFIEGQNCLVFTYGVTSSGKTYTIQGNPRDAGILPRGLDVVFNSISGKQWPGMNLKPNMFCDVMKLTPAQEEQEQKTKERILKLNSRNDLDVMTLLGSDASDYSVMNATPDVIAEDKNGSLDSQEALLAEIENRVREETAVDVNDQGQIRFSVWVSFAEIYNEQIFDLLEPLPKKQNARRPILKLSEDRRGSPYIKGLKEINVTNADEAYKLLTFGQRNLKTACTRLNQCSSRSHCIFNIKIIRVADKGNPQFARVSMLSLCDLAGSERQSKSHTSEERLKEAGNINTSLLTLGRCIELLRYNQQHKENPKIIPFRDSRLTRIFQNFLSGRGKAAMIVNVNQCSSMFDETLNVFKFSAIAKQVIMPPKVEEKPIEVQKSHRQRSTICWDVSATPRLAQLEQSQEDDTCDETESEEVNYVEILEMEVIKLRKELQEMKRDRLNHEVRIRKEVCKEMQEQFVKIEDMYSSLLRDTRQEEEERYEKRLKLLQDSMNMVPCKRPRLAENASGPSNIRVDSDDEWVSSMLLHQEKVKVEERDASLLLAREDLSKLQSKVTALEFQVAHLTRKNNEFVDKIAKVEETKMEVDIAERPKSNDMGQSVLIETLGHQLQEARDRIFQQEKQISDLNEMLTDAGETFHQKESELQKLKTFISENEIKMIQQVETNQELHKMLESSRHTLEEVENHLELKNKTLENMKAEVTELQSRLKLLEEKHESEDCSDSPKKTKEKLLALKNRLKREENDFQQREKALIHGYTAEINNLKSQMAILKSQMQSKPARSTPLKSYTAEKHGSPSKRRKKHADHKEKLKKGDKLEESFRLDVVRQLKELQLELNQNRSMSSELHKKLHDVKHSAEILQQELASKADVESRLEQSQFDLLELQHKFEELSAGNAELKQLLQRQKELQAELADNQSESAELRQKLKIAESSTEDLEKRLEVNLKNQLQAQSGKSEIETLLKETQGRLQQLEKEKKTFESELKKIQEEVRGLAESKTCIQQECESYRLTLEAHNSKIEAMTDERDLLSETIKDLKEQLQAQIKETARVQKTNEELETVNQELRSMVSETVNSLQSHSQEVEKMAKTVEESDREASSNEAQLKSALSEANTLLQERTQQLSALQAQIPAGETHLAQTMASLHKCKLKKQQLKNNLEEALKHMEEKGKEIDNLVKIIESMKLETSASLHKSEETYQQVYILQQELEKKQSEVEVQRQEINSHEEAYQQQIKDLEEKNTELNRLIGEHSAIEKAKQLAAEQTLAEQKVKENLLEASVAEKEKIIMAHQAEAEAWKEERNIIDTLKAGAKQTEDKYSETMKQLQKVIEENTSLMNQVQELQFQISEVNSRLSEACLEKEQLASVERSLQDNYAQLIGVHEALQGQLNSKEKTVIELNCALEQLKEQISGRDVQDTQFSQATLEIADLRSKLYMEAALHQKYKENVDTIQNEKDAISLEANKLQEENQKLIAEISSLNRRLSLLEDQNKEDIDQIKIDLERSKSSVDHLTAELEHMKGMNERLKEELESVEKKLKKSQQEEELLRKSLEQMRVCLNENEVTSRGKLESLEKKLKESQQEEERLRKSNEQVISELKRDPCESAAVGTSKVTFLSGKPSEVSDENEKVKELKAELKAEKIRNSKLKQQLENLISVDSVQEAPGNARRLRKEKIQIESELAGAQFEIERLKRQLENVLNKKEVFGSTASSSSSSCLVSPIAHFSPASLSAAQNCDGNDDVHRENFLEQLQEKEQQYHKAETAHQRCECELLELKSKLSNVTSELKEAQASLKQSASLSTSLQERDVSFLQVELKKSQDREASLRFELQQASTTMIANNTTTSQLEEKLAEKCRALEEVQRRLHELETELEYSRNGDEVTSRMRQLEEEVERKNERLRAKQQRVQELQWALTSEQAQRELITKDSKANEGLIQKLKDTLVEEQETMDKLEILLSEKEEEIRMLTAELDKMSDRYEQLFNQKGETGRELHDLTCARVRLETEKEQLSKDCSEAVQEKTKMMQDLAAAKAEKEASVWKIKLVESEKEKLLREMEVVKKEKDAAVLRYNNAVLENDELERKMKAAIDKKQELEDQLNVAHTECKRLTSDLEKAGQGAQSKIDHLSKVEKELARVKRAYEKDSQHFLVHETNEGDLKLKIKSLQTEIEELKEKLVKCEEEKLNWREQRDQIIGHLETMMKNLTHENKTLKAQIESDQEHYRKLLDQERIEKKELKKQLKVVQRAKDTLLMDMRNTNHQLQVELAEAQGLPLPPRPPPPQHYSFRVNESDLVDDIDTKGHLKVDATPPVAAKNLRKGRKRMTSILSSSSDSGKANTSKSQKPKQVKQDSLNETALESPDISKKSRPLSRLEEFEEKVMKSPITRSAKKLFRMMSPERKKSSSTEQEVTSDSVPEGSSTKKVQRKTMKDDISEPFNCAPYQASLAEVRKSSRLRGRQTSKQSLV